ncbi:MAG: HlyD family efflux transporter periplasmic adaptor subunit [Cyanobacteria bacterium P01_A01_bin.105]
MTDPLSSEPINPAALSEVIPHDFLPPVHRWQRLGGLAGVMTVGAALVLSQVITFKSTVKAPAAIRPTGELRVVQAAAAGQVRQIIVQENDPVQTGDVLAYLDDSRLQSQQTQLEETLTQTQRQLQQVNNQRQAIDRQITATRDETEKTINAAQAQLRLSERQFSNQQTATQADVRGLQAAVDLAQTQVDRYRRLVERGAIAASQLEEKEVILTTAQARLDTALATANPSRAEVTIAQQQVSQLQAQGSATQARLQQERETLIQQTSQLTDQISQTQQALAQLTTQLEKAVIRAPASGIIQSLALRNPNPVVAAGDTLAQIAPAGEPPVGKAWVAPQAVSKLELGQSVMLRITACPYPDYGTLPAHVRAISPDALPISQLPASLQASSRLYEVTLQLEQLELTANDLPCPLQSGMEAQADILTEEETVWRYLRRKLRLTTQL